MLVFLFLGRLRTALIPALAVPVSLVAPSPSCTCSVFAQRAVADGIDPAAGLVVDDAIVVLENIARHIDDGMPPLKAAYVGTREVGFTPVVDEPVAGGGVRFHPYMGGIVERLFREFSITLAAAILVSLLAADPDADALRPLAQNRTNRRRKGRLQRWSHDAHQWLLRYYDRSLSWALRHRRITLLSLLATIALNVVLYVQVLKTFLPQQDTGQITGFIRGDDGMSFRVMQPKMEIFRKAVPPTRRWESVAGFIGGQGGINNAFMIVRLKPLGERKISAQKVIERIRKNQPKVPGTLFLAADQTCLAVVGRAARPTPIRCWRAISTTCVPVPRVTRRYPNCRSYQHRRQRRRGRAADQPEDRP